jgi:hypothetical protein
MDGVLGNLVRLPGRHAREVNAPRH